MAAKGVIAATDGSEESLRAVEWAAREAVLRRDVAAHRVGADAPAAHESRPGRSPRPWRGILDQGAQHARWPARRERAAQIEPSLAVTTEVLAGSPAQALLKAAADASLLVVGSRGAGGFTAMVLGSVSRYLATRAPCPVVVAREETKAVHREIVVGVRDPDQAAAALRFGFEEARPAQRQADGRVRVGLVAPVERGGRDTDPAGTGDHEHGSDIRAYAATRLESVLAAWQDNYPAVQAGWEIVHAHPARALIAASGRADLVVLGRHAAGSSVGSITHPVLSHAHGPVAIVPGD